LKYKKKTEIEGRATMDGIKNKLKERKKATT